MRWSWPSFAGGAACGALLALLLFTATRAPDAADSPRDTWRPGELAAADRAADGTTPAGEPEDSTEVAPESASGAPPARPTRERVHANPEATGAVEGAVPGDPADDGASPPASFMNSSFTIISSDGMALEGGVRVQLRGGTLGFFTSSGESVRPDETLEGAFAEAAATRHGIEGGVGDEAEIRRLLASASYFDRAAGLALAARHDPVLLDLILTVAEDTAYPSLRAAALGYAHTHAADDPAVRDLILRAADDRQLDVREAALARLIGYGRAGAVRAGELLASGDYSAQMVPVLTNAIVAGGLASAVLARPLSADAALSLASAVLQAAETNDAAAQAAAYGSASLVSPHLARASDESTNTFLIAAAQAGFGDLLAGIAADVTLPGRVRMVAAEAALAQAGTLDEGLRAFAGLLNDSTVPSTVLVDALAALDASHVADPDLQSAIARAASSHDNPWVREVAERRLREAGHAVRAGLVVHLATYGAGGKEVDVTGELRALVKGGRLDVTASNDIAGDPNVGVLKTLLVEYSVDGVRRVRTVTEGRQLTLP